MSSTVQPDIATRGSRSLRTCWKVREGRACCSAAAVLLLGSRLPPVGLLQANRLVFSNAGSQKLRGEGEVHVELHNSRAQ